MKKSTILVILAVYLIAFFVVGLLGISIRSNYVVNYVNEIQVTAVEDQPYLTLTNHEREEKKELKEEDTKYYNTYTYRVAYEKNIIAKFKVRLLPDNTSFTKFNIYYTESSRYTVEVHDNEFVYVTFLKGKTNALITLESIDGNKTYSTIDITAR